MQTERAKINHNIKDASHSSCAILSHRRVNYWYVNRYFPVQAFYLGKIPVKIYIILSAVIYQNVKPYLL